MDLEKYSLNIPSPMLKKLRAKSKKTHISVSEIIRMGIEIILGRKC